MKKIGILTFQNTINYGAVLQLYALYNTIKKLGGNPIVIDYENEAIESREFPKLRWNMLPMKMIRIFIQKIMTYKKRLKFDKFMKDSFLLSEKHYNKSNFFQISEEMGNIIVGSDQVWNTNLTTGDLNYFLPLSDVKKFSYAASFGIEDSSLLSNPEKIGKLLNEFSKISTRETIGKKIVEELSDFKGEHTLDPTFLLDKEQWEEFSDSGSQNTTEKYLLLYFIKEKSNIDFAKRYAKSKGLKIKYISMRPYAGRNIEIISDASPIDFIQLIANAEAVIAGSYHGFILSLNLNKPVLVSMDSGKYNKNSRIDSIVEIFNFDKEKIIFDRENENQDFYCDYEKVNDKLSSLRNESLNFIKSIIEN